MGCAAWKLPLIHRMICTSEEIFSLKFPQVFPETQHLHVDQPNEGLRDEINKLNRHTFSSSFKGDDDMHLSDLGSV